VTVWKDQCEAWDGGEAAADWFSQYLDVPCRLVYMPDETFRPINPKYLDRRQPVSFADGFPFLLISEESLGELNSRLKDPVEMRRFRPNLDRKSTRLNSSHVKNSYADFCLKKKKQD